MHVLCINTRWSVKRGSLLLWQLCNILTNLAIWITISTFWLKINTYQFPHISRCSDTMPWELEGFLSSYNDAQLLRQLKFGSTYIFALKYTVVFMNQRAQLYVTVILRQNINKLFIYYVMYKQQQMNCYGFLIRFHCYRTISRWFLICQSDKGFPGFHC